MLRWWEPPTPGLLEFVGTWGVVCWLNHHYHRPYQADAWSTTPDRFWVGTSLNHLASSFQDTIHILCRRISLLLHATVMAFQFVHLQTKPFSAHFMLVTYWKELPVSRHGLKNWLPKRRLKSGLPRRTAARRTPALEGYFSIAQVDEAKFTQPEFSRNLKASPYAPTYFFSAEARVKLFYFAQTVWNGAVKEIGHLSWMFPLLTVSL